MTPNFDKPHSVSLEIGSRTLPWVFDVNAMIALQESLGDDCFEKIAELGKEADAVQAEGEAAPNGKPRLKAQHFKTFVAIIHCGLASMDEPPTLKQLGKELNPFRDIPRLLPECLKALNDNFPTQETAGTAGA